MVQSLYEWNTITILCDVTKIKTVILLRNIYIYIYMKKTHSGLIFLKS